MKNGSSEILEAKVAERNERAKKLYRYISDLARRVGEMTSSSQSVMDLFSMHIEIQRQKLRDNCEKLLFLDPLNYGKKTLELLWRKVYYDTVCTAKKLQESDLENNGNLFTHIVCGIGHFHHFISKIQTDLKVTIKELDYISVYDDEDSEENGETPTDDEIQFGKSILHSCLIYLGDLSRYQAEIFHNFDSSIAARYYLQAAHIDMASGMPYNQLGNLYLDKNYNLDSACYYIHCLNCATPFEGAVDNLNKIFEKNEQFLETLHDPDTLIQAENIQNTIVNFLSLIEIWYFSKNDTNIPQRCSTIAQDLKISMDFIKSPLPDIETVSYDEYLQAIEDESVIPTYLNPNLVNKIVQICLFTISKMMESDETKAFSCKAFTLALYSQLLQKLLKQLNFIGLKNPASNYRERSHSIQDRVELTIEEVEPEPVVKPLDIPNGNVLPNDNIDKEIEGETEVVTNGDVKCANKKINKRRRRRRLASSGSSDISNVDSESEPEIESCSEEEEGDSESTYHSGDETNSEHSDEETDEEENTKCNGDHSEEPKVDNSSNEVHTPLTNGNTKENNNEHKETEKSDSETEEFKESELKKFLLGDNFLASAKLLQDWILTEKDLILSCGESGDSLFQCVVDLLNILSHYFTNKMDKAIEKESQVLHTARNLAKKNKLEYKNTPLPEDINLRGTNICKFDKDAAEWQILDRRNISVYEENVIRILNFIDFGNQIAKIVPRIRFNRTMKIFYLKKVPPSKENSKINHKRSREWHNSKKQPHIEQPDGGLLRKLGHLWLVSQVRELERSGRQPATPALLALDTAVLHKHLRRVKQLLRTKNFILLIPAVVLQELDTLKREQSSARDAIRWLELQLKTGSRFLRAQRPGQSRPLPLLKYPRKAPPHINNFIQILEFCNHFVGEDKGGNGDTDNSLTKSIPILVLLMGDKPGADDERYKEFSVTGAAKSAGISVDYIEDFYTKWRQSINKSGKKR